MFSPFSDTGSSAPSASAQLAAGSSRSSSSSKSSLGSGMSSLLNHSTHHLPTQLQSLTHSFRSSPLAPTGSPSASLVTDKTVRQCLVHRRVVQGCRQLHAFLCELRNRKALFSSVFYPVFDDILATLWGSHSDRKAWIMYCAERELLEVFSTQGSFFEAVFHLSAYPPIQYHVPIRKLPRTTRQLVAYKEVAAVSPLFAGKLGTPNVIEFSLYEYYFYCFVYFPIVGPKPFKPSREELAFLEPENHADLYQLMLEDHLFTFFPHVPHKHRGRQVTYGGERASKGESAMMRNLDFQHLGALLMAFRQQTQRFRAAGQPFNPDAHVFSIGTTLGPSSVASAAFSNSDSATSVSPSALAPIEFSHAETFLLTMLEWWFNQNNPEATGYTDKFVRPSEEMLLSIHRLVLHFLANPEYTRQEHPALQALAVPLFNFLHAAFTRWPLERITTFPLVLVEIWMAFCQPWNALEKYAPVVLSDTHEVFVDGVNISAARAKRHDEDPLAPGALRYDESWRPYVEEHLCFYTVLLGDFVRIAMHLALNKPTVGRAVRHVMTLFRDEQLLAAMYDCETQLSMTVAHSFEPHHGPRGGAGSELGHFLREQVEIYTLQPAEEYVGFGDGENKVSAADLFHTVRATMAQLKQRRLGRADGGSGGIGNAFGKISGLLSAVTRDGEDGGEDDDADAMTSESDEDDHDENLVRGGGAGHRRRYSRSGLGAKLFDFFFSDGDDDRAPPAKTVKFAAVDGKARPKGHRPGAAADGEGELRARSRGKKLTSRSGKKSKGKATSQKGKAKKGKKDRPSRREQDLARVVEMLRFVFQLDDGFLQRHFSPELHGLRATGPNSMREAPLEPERDHSEPFRLTERGRWQVRRGQRVCSKEDVPFFGDTWDRPVESHELGALVRCTYRASERINRWLYGACNVRGCSSAQLSRTDLPDELGPPGPRCAAHCGERVVTSALTHQDRPTRVNLRPLASYYTWFWLVVIVVLAWVLLP